MESREKELKIFGWRGGEGSRVEKERMQGDFGHPILGAHFVILSLKQTWGLHPTLLVTETRPAPALRSVTALTCVWEGHGVT